MIYLFLIKVKKWSFFHVVKQAQTIYFEAFIMIPLSPYCSHIHISVPFPQTEFDLSEYYLKPGDALVQTEHA